MGTLIVQHRVRDYRKWRRAYDAHAPMRRKAALGSARVYRGTDDPDQIAIVFKVGDAEKAKAFLESEDLRKAMKAAGVVGKPTMTLVAEGPLPAPRPATPLGAARRSLPEKPAEASADTWRRFQQAFDALHKKPAKPARAKKP